MILTSLSSKYIFEPELDSSMCFEFPEQNLTDSAENVCSWRIEYFYIQAFFPIKEEKKIY